MGAWFTSFMLEQVSKNANDDWLQRTISFGGEFRALMAGVALGAFFHEGKFGLEWERSNLMIPLQRIRLPGLDTIMQVLGMFADELIVPYFAALYWTLDKYKCVYGIWLVPISEILNGCLKWSFRVPRPGWVDSRVRSGWMQEYSFPSSHAQIIWALATFFSGTSIGKLRQRLLGSLGVTRLAYWYSVVGPLAFASCVSISRVYEGVHYPRDIAVGAGIGVALASCYMRVLPAIDAYVQAQPEATRHILLQCTTLLGGAFVYRYWRRAHMSHLAQGPLFKQNIETWRQSVIRGRGSRAGDVGMTLDPLGVPLTNYVGMTGVLSGLALAQVAMLRTPLEAPETWTAAALRNAVGLAGLMAMFLGLRAVEQRISNAMIKNAIRFARHMGLPVWILNVAPLVFQRLGI